MAAATLVALTDSTGGAKRPLALSLVPILSNADLAAPETPSNSPPVGLWVGIGLALLLASGAVGYFSFAPEVAPPSAEVANDPFLLEGRGLFLTRCVPCHGVTGKGDGPLAASFAGQPVGDLTDGRWKNGDRPEDVLRVVRAGVPGTRMAGWGPLLEDAQIRAVAAYCYTLSKLPVPGLLRQAEAASAVAPR